MSQAKRTVSVHMSKFHLVNQKCPPYWVRWVNCHRWNSYEMNYWSTEFHDHRGTLCSLSLRELKSRLQWVKLFSPNENACLHHAFTGAKLCYFVELVLAVKICAVKIFTHLFSSNRRDIYVHQMKHIRLQWHSKLVWPTILFSFRADLILTMTYEWKLLKKRNSKNFSRTEKLNSWKMRLLKTRWLNEVSYSIEAIRDAQRWHFSPNIIISTEIQKRNWIQSISLLNQKLIESRDLCAIIFGQAIVFTWTAACRTCEYLLEKNRSSP